MRRNYTYSSDNVVVIVTADSMEDAGRLMRETVIRPESFVWECAERR